MGVFSDPPQHFTGDWIGDKIRKIVKEKFPFVQTVVFIKDFPLAKYHVRVVFYTGQQITVSFSEELEPFTPKNFNWTMEQVTQQIITKYNPPKPIGPSKVEMDYALKPGQWKIKPDPSSVSYANIEHKLKEMLENGQLLKSEYDKVLLDAVESYPKPIIAHNYMVQADNALTEKLKSMTVPEMMKEYANKYLTPEQIEIVKKATLDWYSQESSPVAPSLIGAGGVSGHLAKILPALSAKVKCPKCKHNTSLQQTIIHMNDRHKMPREDIADWVESLDLDIEFKSEEVTR